MRRLFIITKYKEQKSLSSGAEKAWLKAVTGCEFFVRNKKSREIDKIEFFKALKKAGYEIKGDLFKVGKLPLFLGEEDFLYDRKDCNLVNFSRLTFLKEDSVYRFCEVLYGKGRKSAFNPSLVEINENKNLSTLSKVEYQRTRLKRGPAIREPQWKEVIDRRYYWNEN